MAETRNPVRSRPGGPAAPAGRVDDPNLTICGLLHDLAHIYRDEPKQAAYKRAARVIAGLDRPIVELRAGDRLAKLPGIGPSIERLIIEFLDTGTSARVEQALAGASEDRKRSVEKRRAVRDGFLSIARARQILLADQPGAVAAGDFLGDLQQHSLWSDGSETIEEIVEDSIRLGQKYAALTDHYSLPIAGSLTAGDFEQQHAEIDELNRRYEGRFRLLKGVEANILADGTVDVSDAELPGLELVVASPHSLLRRQEDQTARMLRAVKQRGVDILGHPRGRKFNDREGLHVDWDAVFRAAAEHDVAIELDGSWDRQDIDYRLAARALELGCLFAVDSDAHNQRERHFSAIALAHARLAGIPAERIVNCWPVEKLLTWAARR